MLALGAVKMFVAPLWAIDNDPEGTEWMLRPLQAISYKSASAYDLVCYSLQI
jgi:hypothetical protein